MLLRLTIVFLLLTLHGPAFADWQFSAVATDGRVDEIESIDGEVRIAIGKAWYKLNIDATGLQPAAAFEHRTPPPGAIPDARVATGHEVVARTWLAEPTERYRHGVLGDTIEAGRLVIELRSGGQRTLRLGTDAVFEDLEPRIAMIGGSEKIVLVKSYLKRGSALAVIDPKSASVVAETPAIGHPHAWLNPAGIADFNGDGATDIALVRQPHVVGVLEVWSWQNDRLEKSAEVAGVSNHFIGSRSLHMSQVFDFDGDGHPDLAIPDLERRTLRLISFRPTPHDIARIKLPSRIATNIGALKYHDRLALLFGLEDGQLILAHD